MTLCAVLLSACNASTEEVELPPLSAQSQSYEMDGWRVDSFGVFCGYVQLSEELEVHPYFDLPQHITMRKIDLSGKPFLELTETCFTESVSQTYGDVTVVSNGVKTYGYRSFGDVAIVAETDTLPMGYVRIALEHACLPDS